MIKEWRRAQTAQAAPVVVAVADAVQEASSAAVAAIWLQAQELANESLRNAQAAWEVELRRAGRHAPGTGGSVRAPSDRA